jgi:hypothetical protein
VDVTRLEEHAAKTKLRAGIDLPAKKKTVSVPRESFVLVFQAEVGSQVPLLVHRYRLLVPAARRLHQRFSKIRQERTAAGEYHGRWPLWGGIRLRSPNRPRSSTGYGVSAVDPEHVLTSVLRKLVCLAVIGFLVVVLIGPILALLGVLISFALIGLLVWLPIRTLLYGKPFDWAKVKAVSRKYGGAVFGRCHHVADQALAHGHPVLEKVQAAGRFVALVFRETVCGALVGALLAVLRVPEASFHIKLVLLGAGIGALVGAVVALACHSPARESAEVS